MEEEKTLQPSGQETAALDREKLEGVAGGVNMPELWKDCPKCGAPGAYSIATSTCKVCGYCGASSLFGECPKCGAKAFMKVTGHCYSCGYDK